MMWELGYQLSTGAIEPELAELVAGLIAAGDEGTCSDFASSIEYQVAPPRGGLGPGVVGAVHAIVAGLLEMRAELRHCALSLLSQIAGSAAHANTEDGNHVCDVLTQSLPIISELVRHADLDEVAEFVDLIALCAMADPEARARVSFYLTRISTEIGGAVGESAARELREIRRQRLEQPDH
jgi:hypothetical protein